MNGDDDLAPYAHTEVPPAVRSALQVLTNEVHACTVAVGRLTAEVANLRADLRTFQNRVARMRDKLESVPETAEDTARHEVEKLRQELARQETIELQRQLEERRASQRVAADRKWQLAIQAGALLVASALGGLLTHLWHVLGK